MLNKKIPFVFEILTKALNCGNNDHVSPEKNAIKPIQTFKGKHEI